MIMVRLFAAGFACLMFTAVAADFDLDRQFADPPLRYGPSCYWWWFGGVYTPTEIRENLDALKAAGLGGFRIFPVYALATDDPARGIRNAPYLSPEFLELVQTAVEHGRKLGLAPESLLGTGWPYGGPYIPPELGAGQLKFFSEQVDGPRHFSGRVPGEAKRPERLLAVQAAEINAEGGVSLDTVVDLTGRCRDWQLKWQVPPGRWLLMSFVSGYTGMKAKRASPGGEGLVLDHFCRTAVELHLRHTGERLAPRLKGTLAVSMDSWEVFGSNWTPALPEEFQRRRGYSLLPYLASIFLPVGETGARVRYDFRRTLSELALENLFTPLKEWAHGNGFQTRVEAHGTPADILEAYGLNDFPEGESYGEQDRRVLNVRDRKLASSAGHLFGRTQVSCEAFTWLRYPLFLVTLENMKAAADAAYLDGINQINYHGVPLSPAWAEPPGWFYYAATNVSRGNTWWPYLKRLSDYLRRVNFLLQRGVPVTDIAVYLPYEDIWSEAYGDWYDLAGAIDKRFTATGVSRMLTALRDAGFDFDFINKRRLGDARIEAGVLRAGPMAYRAVILPGVEAVEASVLEVLERFCRQGGLVIAADRLPTRSAGLLNHAEEDARVRLLVERMFGPAGAGQFVPRDPAAALAPRTHRAPLLVAKHISPDLVFEPSDPGVGFVHRRSESEDIYFLANVSPHPKRFRARFRAVGRAPSLLDSETGSVRPLHPMNPEGTEMELKLDSWGSLFVILRDGRAPAILATNVDSVLSLNDNSAAAETTSNGEFFVQTPARTLRASVADLPAPLSVRGPWELFRDGTTKRQLEALVSWTALPEWRFFSGTASYRTIFNIPETYLRPRTRLWLDLGEVHDIGEVLLNGEPAGVSWKHPHQVDITGQAKRGANELVVRVTNRLINRMLCSAPLPAPYVPLRDRISEPVSSGLLGPVRLRPVREIVLE